MEAEKEYSGGFFDDKNDEVNELAKKLEESKKYEAEIKSKYIEEEKKLTKIEIKLKELKEAKEKSITSDADEKYASEEFLKSKENVEKQFYNIKQWVVESRKINSELKEVCEWLKNHSESSKPENINYFEYKENINKQKELSSEIEKLQKNIVHAAKLIHEYKEDVEFWKDPLSVLNPTLLKNIEDFVREKYLFNYEKDNLVLVLGNLKNAMLLKIEKKSKLILMMQTLILQNDNMTIQKENELLKQLKKISMILKNQKKWR
ncbi:hypothetical protein [Mycoplasmopsis cynos]|uniref:hypothetical protein n=1 Tax=Mycoplasmopsis cynos TaxID=171284 RepID=UPI0021FC6CE8|nr:hypothetical protein [Mycoplasmopsis cynos]UWV92474.1 hypothetical protein NWE57_06555 [Mycoplasmopsis cynos]